MPYALHIKPAINPICDDLLGSITISDATYIRWTELAHEFAKEPNLLYVQLFMPGAIAPFMTLTRGAIERVCAGPTMATEAASLDREAEERAPAD